MTRLARGLLAIYLLVQLIALAYIIQRPVRIVNINKPADIVIQTCPKETSL